MPNASAHPIASTSQGPWYATAVVPPVPALPRGRAPASRGPARTARAARPRRAPAAALGTKRPPTPDQEPPAPAYRPHRRFRPRAPLAPASPVETMPPAPVVPPELVVPPVSPLPPEPSPPLPPRSVSPPEDVVPATPPVCDPPPGIGLPQPARAQRAATVEQTMAALMWLLFRLTITALRLDRSIEPSHSRSGNRSGRCRRLPRRGPWPRTSFPSSCRNPSTPRSAWSARCGRRCGLLSGC